MGATGQAPEQGLPGGFGQMEVFQLAVVDGRPVLLFNCLPKEHSARRQGTGTSGAIWVANAESPLGPYDIAGATPLSDDRYHVGKLIQDPDGDWVLLAFENIGDDGVFIGAVSAPMPVRWEAGRLVVATAEPCAEDEQVVRAVTAMSGPKPLGRDGALVRRAVRVGAVRVLPRRQPIQ